MQKRIRLITTIVIGTDMNEVNYKAIRRIEQYINKKYLPYLFNNKFN